MVMDMAPPIRRTDAASKVKNVGRKNKSPGALLQPGPRQERYRRYIESAFRVGRCWAKAADAHTRAAILPWHGLVHMANI